MVQKKSLRPRYLWSWHTYYEEALISIMAIYTERHTSFLLSTLNAQNVAVFSGSRLTLFGIVIFIVHSFHFWIFFALSLNLSPSHSPVLALSISFLLTLHNHTIELIALSFSQIFRSTIALFLILFADFHFVPFRLPFFPFSTFFFSLFVARI